VKTLHLLRHAKSDWSDPSLDDHDRPLNRRGRRTRDEIAAYVRAWPVDLVVCSTAVRARATAEPVVAALGCDVRFEPAIYDASAGELLDVVHRLPDEAGVVMLVGHNPGLEVLTSVLCGPSPRLPTGALATIRLEVDHWAGAEPGGGQLAGLVTSADLGGRPEGKHKHSSGTGKGDAQD
jgi:phosphohistidine phosphatase